MECAVHIPYHPVGGRGRGTQEHCMFLPLPRRLLSTSRSCFVRWWRREGLQSGTDCSSTIAVPCTPGGDTHDTTEPPLECVSVHWGTVLGPVWVLTLQPRTPWGPGTNQVVTEYGSHPLTTSSWTSTCKVTGGYQEITPNISA